MTKVRNRPVVLNAVCWNGKMDDIVMLIGHPLPPYEGGEAGSIQLFTYWDEYIQIRRGDWIVGKDGDWFVCSPEEFRDKFELV